MLIGSKVSVGATLALGRGLRAVSSVSQAEVDRFNRLKSDWWKQDASSGAAPLHGMNSVRVNYIRERLLKHKPSYTSGDAAVPGHQLVVARSTLPFSEQLKGITILDAGCGGGLAAESLSRLGATVVGIDPAPDTIEVAKQHAQTDPQTATIDYRVATIEQLSTAGEKFDAVCSLEVIEHTTDPQLYLQHCAACIKPGGHLFLTTINKTIASYLIAILGAEYIARVVPKGTHEWSKFISPQDVKVALRRSGMYVDEVKGMVFHPLTHECSLSDTHTGVNYILHAIKRTA